MERSWSSHINLPITTIAYSEKIEHLLSHFFPFFFFALLFYTYRSHKLLLLAEVHKVGVGCWGEGGWGPYFFKNKALIPKDQIAWCDRFHKWRGNVNGKNVFLRCPSGRFQGLFIIITAVELQRGITIKQFVGSCFWA